MELNGTITAGAHISPWTATTEAIRYEALGKNEKADVVIIGGGIAGVSTAYALSIQNKKVILVEDGYIGSGESGRTTAHLVTSLDDRYYNLERLHGEEGAKLAAESHAKAIDFVQDAVNRENIRCDFTRLNGYLFRHPSDNPESLEKEYIAAQRAGVPTQLLEQTPGLKTVEGQCIVFPLQAQFHIINYLKGLCEAIIRRGGKIYTETHAEKIDTTGIVSDKGFRVDAEHVVVATNSPVNDLLAIHTKQMAYRSYVIGAKVKKGSVMTALWWDSGDYDKNSDIPPYHYVRIQPFNDTHDLLIAGGEDHLTGEKSDTTEEQRYSAVEDWTRARFDIEDVVYRWSGQVLETMDSLAFIGRNPGDKKNVYIITGDSGNGMTHCTIGAMLITDLILGIENKWEKLYDPSRFKIFKAAKGYLKDGITVMKEFMSDLPFNDKMSVISKIKNNEGKVVQLKGEKYGVYRDEKGKLHIVSAVCPHLQCIVRWNDGEKSWDCPCHGSRFTCEGKVLNGPANTDLPYCLSDKLTKTEKS